MSKLPMALLARAWTLTHTRKDVDDIGSKVVPRHAFPDGDLSAFTRRMSSLAELLMKRGGFSERLVVRALVDPKPKTKEKVARWLSDQLKKLRENEKQAGSAPVRRNGMLSRLVVADAAITMVQFIDGAPGENLICLLQELLDVDRHRRSLSKERGDSFELAVFNEASAALQGKAIGVRELARLVSVEASTITRWRRTEVYQQAVRGEQQQLNAKLRPLVDDLLRNDPRSSRHEAYRYALQIHQDRKNPRWSRNELKSRLARAKSQEEVLQIFERHVVHRQAFYEIRSPEADRLRDLCVERIVELKNGHEPE